MHSTYMQEAIEEAHKARLIDEVPIGAVVVYKGEVIGRGHNQRETLGRSYRSCRDDRHPAGG